MSSQSRNVRRARGATYTIAVLLALTSSVRSSTGVSQPPAPPPPGAQVVLPSDPVAPQPSSLPPSQPKPGQVSLKSLPPTQRLGARVNLVERQFQIIPSLVLVPDQAAYLAAIRGWTTTKTGATRYPVLIDDGTWAARTRIARFVRAFNPKNVLRWDGPAPAKPADPKDTAFLVQGVAAINAQTKQWESMGFAPPGVVVCSPSDPAWTAAVALAAFHGEPIIWTDAQLCPPDPAGYIMLEQADAFNASIMKSLGDLGHTWNQLGDDIDAVTLCMTTATKAWLGPDDKRKFFALTDIIGRTEQAGGRKRWAWCGQIMGDAPHAAYDAMCALFLTPDRAWLFDGYDSSQPWDAFDMTKAAAELNKIGMKSIVDDGPSGKGLIDLRRREAGVRIGAPSAAGEPGMGIDAGLISFNTSGNADFFDLKPGQGKSVDVPILRRPAMVYFVHSFSASVPRARWSIGGMWLERGAYAYLGSVEEPYLQAFVPTPIAMRRLAAGIPWGAAVRTDDGTIWKLAVFGDPLITLGPQGPRSETLSVPLNNTQDLGAQLPALLKDRNFEAALWTLTLTGRDKDAARLLAALSKEDGAKLTPQVALAGISSVFFTGDYQTLLAAAAAIAPPMNNKQAVDTQGLAEIRDMVWQAIAPIVNTLNATEADLLLSFIRPETHDRDRAEAGAK